MRLQPTLDFRSMPCGSRCYCHDSDKSSSQLGQRGVQCWFSRGQVLPVFPDCVLNPEYLVRLHRDRANEFVGLDVVLTDGIP